MKRELPQELQVFLENGLRYEVDPNEFINLVANSQNKFTFPQIISCCRKRELILIRRPIQFLLYKFALIDGEIPSLTKIASYFWGKPINGIQRNLDHATIIHSISSHQDLMDSNDSQYGPAFMKIASLFIKQIDSKKIDSAIKLDMCRKMFNDEQKDLIMFLIETYYSNPLVMNFLREKRPVDELLWDYLH